MADHKQTRGIGLVIAGLSACVVAGCGTSMNPTSSSPAGSIQPQSQRPAGPTLGYVWDAASQALRPVQGVPGASIVGSAIVSASNQGAAVLATASSSLSGMALFLDANGRVFQAPLSGGKLTQVASLPGASGLALSNTGAYALVTGRDYSGVTIASVISGLPQSPSTRALNVSSLSTILGAAASDTGTVALAAGSSQSGASVVAFVGQAVGAQVATLQGFGGMQFVPNSDELVVADAASGALTAISHVNTTPSTATLSPAGGIAAPVALDVTSNARWAVAANHAGDVLRIDLTGAAAATRLHCSCAPSQVLALNGSAASTTVRLVTAGGGPLWILDAGAATPRMLFIPAPSAPTTTTPSAATKVAL
jgi:hypothetical protein